MPSKSSTIEWGMWANEQAVTSAVLLIFGGILGLAGNFQRSGFAIHSLIAGILVLVLEYPRSARKKGRTVERRFQNFLTPFVRMLGSVGANYYVRFLLHLGLSIPALFILTSTLAGLSLLVAAIVYLAAAVVGEKWMPYEDVQEEPRQRTKISEPPSRVPPRGPHEPALTPNERQLASDTDNLNESPTQPYAAVSPDIGTIEYHSNIIIPKPPPKPLASIRSDIERPDMESHCSLSSTEGDNNNVATLQITQDTSSVRRV